jgi:hypothetical protein
MDKQHFRQLAKETLSEFTQLEPESNNTPRGWKLTLGWEWAWFVGSLLGSWLLANILEFVVPAETMQLAIGIFVVVYATRLTVWSIKELGKE